TVARELADQAGDRIADAGQLAYPPLADQPRGIAAGVEAGGRARIGLGAELLGLELEVDRDLAQRCRDLPRGHRVALPFPFPLALPFPVSGCGVPASITTVLYAGGAEALIFLLPG